MRYQIRTVDVFSSQALEGNQLAVVLGADDLDAGIMQSLAKEMNISETTFVAAPKKEGQLASLRIFTPRTELPFAGHPTLGTRLCALERGPGAARGRRLHARGEDWTDCHSRRSA